MTHDLEQRRKVELEITEALRDSEKLPFEYQVKRLMAVYDANMILSIAPLQLDKQDFNMIISDAKSRMVTMPTRIKIDKKEVHSSELRNLAMIEAVVGRLNFLKALKRLPIFKYTQ